MHKIIKIIALASIFYLPLQIAHAYSTSTINAPVTQVNENQVFRDMVIHYVRAVANHKILNAPLPKSQLDLRWSDNYQHSRWSVQVMIYYQGHKIGQGSAQQAGLTQVVTQATEDALSQVTLPKISEKELSLFRFKVSFDYYPNQYYSFIEYLDKGLELIGNRIAIRLLNTQLLKQQIANSQQYLLNAMHPSLHGFSKAYNAALDTRDDELRTIYSSSSLYTFLKLYQLNRDPKLEKHFKPIADFILSMQLQSGPNTGGFYYSYEPNTNKKSCRLVVGTASKTIFTLLELYHFYHDDKYLAAAKHAGDWLLTMIKPDGQVTPVAQCNNNIWHYNNRQSFLYSGQVLSALSRLYRVTKDQRYYAGATKIANHFISETQKQGLFLGDNYRPQNTISTSWVLMSLIDYAKINHDEIYRKLIRQLSKSILSMQILDSHDIYLYGRYRDTRKPSGNGWINEVIGSLYEFCQSSQLTDCQQYRKPMILTSRWLMQNSYTQANTYDIKNPSQAIGGFISFFSTQLVRTDAVCHGVNSLIILLQMVGQTNQTLLVVPERPLADVLPSLRAGQGFL